MEANEEYSQWQMMSNHEATTSKPTEQMTSVQIATC
jgi:hypothetical protein